MMFSFYRGKILGAWRGAIPLVALLLAGTALAQPPVTRTPPQDQFRPPASSPGGEPVVPAIVVSPDEDYRIESGDVIEVQVQMAPELSNSYRVTAAGTFYMPYLGYVAARQRTPEQLGAEISDRLRGKYLKNPSVRVLVRQIHSHSFFIQGAVRRPGVYQIEGRPTLLELITVGGGLGENHGSTAFILHKVKKPGGAEADAPAQATSAPPASPAAAPDNEVHYELIKVSIAGLLKGRFDQNVRVEPGDIVNIPPTDVFFVAGEVRQPGSFPLKDGTTLRQAVSLAQGPTFNAQAARGVIFREDVATGKRTEIKVDIAAVMSGKQEDLVINPNDIIIVPNSRMKTVGGALLTAFGLNAARLPYRGW
jgi:polysaccharide biosynthesis/export protein